MKRKLLNSIGAIGVIFVAALLLNMVGAVLFEYAFSGTFTAPYRPVDGTARTPALYMSNWTALETEFNGNVESTNIKDGTIVNADISGSAAIADTKLDCSGDWQTVSDCNAAVGNADAMHSHDASNISVTPGDYATDTVAGQLTEIADYVGLGNASSADTTTYHYMQRYKPGAAYTALSDYQSNYKSEAALVTGSGEFNRTYKMPGGTNMSLYLGMEVEALSTSTLNLYIPSVDDYIAVFVDDANEYTQNGAADTNQTLNIGISQGTHSVKFICISASGATPDGMICNQLNGFLASSSIVFKGTATP